MPFPIKELVPFMMKFNVTEFRMEVSVSELASVGIDLSRGKKDGHTCWWETRLVCVEQAKQGIPIL